MNDVTRSIELTKNNPHSTHDVCDLATGEKLGEVGHDTFLVYLEDIENDTTGAGAVDGADYGFDGRTIYIED